MDAMEQMDGLERLICIGVGLDAPVSNPNADASETRSLLYRAMTRAHMMVLVVNEFLPDGWFSFLAQVKLKDDLSFDEEEADSQMKAQAEIMGGMDAAQRVAAERLQADLEKKAAAGLRTWEARNVFARKLRATAPVSDEEYLFTQRSIVGSLRSGQPIEEAVQTAIANWGEESRRISLVQKIHAAAAAEQIDDHVSRGALQTLAAEKVAQGQELADAVTSALSDWKRVRKALEAAAKAQAHMLPAAALPPLQATVTRSGLDAIETAAAECVGEWILDRTLSDAVVECCEAAKAKQLHVHYKAEIAVRSLLEARVRGGATAEAATASVLVLWGQLDAAFHAAIEALQIEQRVAAQAAAVIDLDLFSACDVNGAEPAVVPRLRQWKEAHDARRRAREASTKQEQSIWDPSGNGTAGTAAQEEEKDEDKVAAMQAKYPEAKECVALVKLGLTAADTVS